MTRLDRRGRRIGYNWWREFIMEQYNAAWHAVEESREDNHQMEPDEFSAACPLPRLKDFLIDCAGMAKDPSMS